MKNDTSNNGIRTQDSTALVLTVPEAAEFLRVSESIVRRLIRENRIPYFQIESRYLFYQPALEEWIKRRMVEPNGKSLTITAVETANEIWKEAKG
jgi:excisionase family DNA binding protein